MPLPTAGTQAPSFKLAASDGQTIDSAALKGSRYVLYFYPKADTPGCTIETCAFRDALAGYTGLGVPVFGISPDPVKDVTKFAQKFDVNFPLLADTDHSIADAFGVWGEKQMMGKSFMGVKRTTFVIDADGNVEKVFESVKPEGHDQQVLGYLREGTA